MCSSRPLWRHSGPALASNFARETRATPKGGKCARAGQPGDGAQPSSALEEMSLTPLFCSCSRILPMLSSAIPRVASSAIESAGHPTRSQAKAGGRAHQSQTSRSRGSEHPARCSQRSSRKPGPRNTRWLRKARVSHNCGCVGGTADAGRGRGSDCGRSTHPLHAREARDRARSCSCGRCRRSPSSCRFVDSCPCAPQYPCLPPANTPGQHRHPTR
jgi:hypothetical protein